MEPEGNCVRAYRGVIRSALGRLGCCTKGMCSVLILIGLLVAEVCVPSSAAQEQLVRPSGNNIVCNFSPLAPGSMTPVGRVEQPFGAAVALLSPEVALATYQRRTAKQRLELMSYSATSRIRADLPGTRQWGELELEEFYHAPRSLQFRAVQFEGDKFVKTNVIARMLQVELDHVRKDDSERTALTASNYEFSPKGSTTVEGRPVHVFRVKPRRKYVGLFKGRIYLDTATGSLVRAEGALVKSPSIFIKKIEFAEDYTDFGTFTFRIRLRSIVRARILGDVILHIEQVNYRRVAASFAYAADQSTNCWLEVCER